MSNEKPVNDPIVANRRARLRQWIDEHCGGSQAQFIATTADGDKQINQGELSGLLRSKSFGEKKARALERQAGMPSGYLDVAKPTRDALDANDERAISPSVLKPVRSLAWPFHSVSLQRLTELKRALGPKAGAEALRDLDEQLEIVVTKWERKAASKKKAG